MKNNENALVILILILLCVTTYTANAQLEENTPRMSNSSTKG